MRKYTVFFDFDNTITKFDVIDDMLLKFSKDDKWVELESRWKAKKIGSKECLRGQLKGIRISRARLDKYLSLVTLDPHFEKTLRFLCSKKIKSVILSDDFDYIIKKILKSNHIREPIQIHSNRVRISGSRLIPSFPSSNRDCSTSCGHCKNINLRLNTAEYSTTVYIGDGMSDVCPAQYSDIVFAKGRLLKYFRSHHLACRPYKNLNDVYRYFKARLPARICLQAGREP